MEFCKFLNRNKSRWGLYKLVFYIRRYEITLVPDNSPINAPTIIAGNDAVIVINDVRGKRKAVEEIKAVKKRTTKTRDAANLAYNLDNTHSTLYKIKNVDVLKQWKDYKVELCNYLKENTVVLQHDVQKIMSQVRMILLKKDQASPDIAMFLDNDVLDGIRDEVRNKFNMGTEVLPLEIEHHLKTVMKETMKKQISSRKSGAKVMACCSDEMDSSVDDVLLIIRNLIERLPHKKANVVIKESQLWTTYFDVAVQPSLYFICLRCSSLINKVYLVQV
ncbi:hypothetical protein RMATCC62417_03595 [Rhizopus microsporus]|nr:hypothetical protein RMATCC62417_03595 [Rhizopus microsporus]